MNAVKKYLVWDKNKTFKPKKQHKKGTARYNMHKFAKSLLKTGDLRSSVRCPSDMDYNTWISVQTVDLYNITNLLYGSISEFCTAETCKKMSSGPTVEYRWKDPGRKKPVSVTAPQYVDLLMSWIETLINDESVFPTEEGQPFPKDFPDVVKNIARRLFRVYAHIYYAHFEKICQLEEESHLNTAFKHFLFFCCEHHLIDEQEITPIMRNVITNMLGDTFLEENCLKK
eukprot:TRINITY_DN67584_c0_g3_i1.p1 TRINITY_DN67584_c0_g3~~TRINITY_DN67584_c0_g3_i1.p1  ORF type:complete len:243 (+),score=31.09 TRINITY_DN67584_c0_g3_i1:48-731(+)